MREGLEAAIDNEVLASHSSEKWAFHEYILYRFNRVLDISKPWKMP